MVLLNAQCDQGARLAVVSVARTLKEGHALRLRRFGQYSKCPTAIGVRSVTGASLKATQSRICRRPRRQQARPHPAPPRIPQLARTLGRRGCPREIARCNPLVRHLSARPDPLELASPHIGLCRTDIARRSSPIPQRLARPAIRTPARALASRDRVRALGPQEARPHVPLHAPPRGPRRGDVKPVEPPRDRDGRHPPPLASARSGGSHRGR